MVQVLPGGRQSHLIEPVSLLLGQQPCGRQRGVSIHFPSQLEQLEGEAWAGDASPALTLTCIVSLEGPAHPGDSATGGQSDRVKTHAGIGGVARLQPAEPWRPRYRPRRYFSEVRGLWTHGLGPSPGLIQLQETEILAKKTQVTGARTGKTAGHGEDTLFVWALNLTWPKVSAPRMCAGPRSTPLLGPRSHLYPEPIWKMGCVRNMGIFMGQESGRSWAWWWGAVEGVEGVWEPRCATRAPE